MFFATFFICQFVLMMQFLWRYVDELIGKGLSLEVMAQFFWYMGLMLMPQAFPLAILLSSLITFGNLGESSELTAIKAAGISLLQAMRSLIVIVMAITCISFFFQEVIAPKAFISFRQLLLSMKQKNPEVEIPEGIFYDGIPGSNLMQPTAEKKHLLLTLYSGEWFENMRQSGLGVAANVPYRRETFSTKNILLDFDSGLDMVEAGWIASDARAKSMGMILHDLDSIREFNDSVGHQYFMDASRTTFYRPPMKLYAKLTGEQKQQVVRMAANDAQAALSEMEFKVEYSEGLNYDERMHQLEAMNKITLSLSCLIFFFIGAPLGAIIRKGGLGVPVIISVLVFIVFYILDNTGTKMARDDNWTVWFGKWLGTAVLTPIACFFTYKANNDSVVFNIDLYKNMLTRMLGLRTKRYIVRKEVIIEDPKYLTDAEILTNISLEISDYMQRHKLLRWPNPIRVFFHPGDDNDIEQINSAMEVAIEDLSYSKNNYVLMKLNQYPIIATHAHTRPFRRKWLNAITGLFLPTGIFFYIRMLRFRFRLYRDLQRIIRNNEKLIPRIIQLGNLQKEGSVTVI